MVKKSILALLCAALLLCAACGGRQPGETAPTEGTAVTDALGNTAQLAPDARVVCGYASFAQCWMLAGGVPVGVTDDALTERGLDLPEDTAVVGTTKHVDLEKVAALEPDYVMLSADLTAHLELRDTLERMGIPCGFFRVDTFADYQALMAQLCAVTGREDLYRANVTEPETRIGEILAAVPKQEDRSVLLLRAYASGVKAKGDDVLAGVILKEYGLRNIVDDAPSLLEDLSMEEIIRRDPCWIFVVTMGDEAAAAAYMRQNLESDPAWNGLSAVQGGRCVLLPQDLFHYKPNERWDESYEYLAKILYPDLF